MSIIDRTKTILKEQKHVITVCQHQDLLKHQHIFAKACVNHVYWPYADGSLNCFPEYTSIKIHPFPHAPTKFPNGLSSGNRENKYLYSFIEPRESYKSKIQSHIVHRMGSDQRGLVISRDHWDFQKIVYDKEHEDLITCQESACCPEPIEPFRIIQESIFTLCPPNPGTNTVRLWESISCLSIPVLFSDTSFLPGNKALWKDATVECSEQLEDICALPDRLEVLSQDKMLLKRKRDALRQLWLLYGKDFFIYDIQKLFLSLAQEESNIHFTKPVVSCGKLLAMAAMINQKNSVQKFEKNFFISVCSSLVLTDPYIFLNNYNNNTEFHNAYEEAISSCNSQNSKSMLRNLAFKGVTLNSDVKKRHG